MRGKFGERGDIESDPPTSLPLFRLPACGGSAELLLRERGEPPSSLPLLRFPAIPCGGSAELLLRLGFVRGGVELPSLLDRWPECKAEREGELGSNLISGTGETARREFCRAEREGEGSILRSGGGEVARNVFCNAVRAGEDSRGGVATRREFKSTLLRGEMGGELQSLFESS